MSAIAFFTRALVFCQPWVPSLFNSGGGPVSEERYFWMRSRRGRGGERLGLWGDLRIMGARGGAEAFFMTRGAEERGGACFAGERGAPTGRGGEGGRKGAGLGLAGG